MSDETEKQEEVVEEESVEVCYISPQAPAFSMRVELPGDTADVRVKFAHKELRLRSPEDTDLIAAIDKLIATKPNIASIIHKVDRAAAETLAKAHMGMMASQRGTMTGPVSADDAKRAATMAVQERDADLAAQGASVQDLAAMREEMSKDGLELTENAEGVVAPPTREGFVPANTGEPAAATEVKDIFANLGKK